MSNTGKKFFGTLTMTELRSEPGEVIRDVHRKGRSFVITKGGKPVAKLVPVDSPPLIFQVLCEADRNRVLAPNTSPYLEDGWYGLPKLCPECEAKVAQCTRILATGGAIVPNADRLGKP